MAARQGDPVAVDSYRELARWVGAGLADLASLFDPSAFIVGGGLSDEGELVLDPIRKSYKRWLVGGNWRPVADVRPPSSATRPASWARPTWPGSPTRSCDAAVLSYDPARRSLQGHGGRCRSGAPAPLRQPRLSRDGRAAALTRPAATDPPSALPADRRAAGRRILIRMATTPLLPGSRTEPDGSAVIRVLSYNIRSMRDDTAALARVITPAPPTWYSSRRHRASSAGARSWPGSPPPPAWRSCPAAPRPPGPALLCSLRATVERTEDVLLPLTPGLHRRGLATAVVRFGARPARRAELPSLAAEGRAVRAGRPAPGPARQRSAWSTRSPAAT